MPREMWNRSICSTRRPGGCCGANVAYRRPQFLELDVTELHVNHHLEAKDLKLPNGVTLITEADKVLISCVYSKAEQAAEATAEGALLEAGKAEPEVMKKGKPEDEKAADGKKAGDAKKAPEAKGKK